LDAKRAKKRGEINVAGVGGTSPKTKGQKIVWWTFFTLFFGFFLYVMAKNFL
jgi:hypothetical protein